MPKKHPNLRFVFTHIGYYEFGMSTIMAVKDLDKCMGRNKWSNGYKSVKNSN